MSRHSTPERSLGIGLLGGLIGGLMTGISARIAMRLIALSAGQPTGFTIAGTLSIVFMGLFIGFIGGTIIGILSVAVTQSNKVKKYLRNLFVKDVALGIVLLIVIFPLFAASDEFSLSPIVGRILFGSLFIIYGFTAGIAEILLDRYLPDKALPVEAEKPASQLDAKN